MESQIAFWVSLFTCGGVCAEARKAWEAFAVRLAYGVE